MIKSLFASWKTTSIGLMMIAGSVIHLIFSIRTNTADENSWTAAIGIIIGGIGLIFAGDAGTSVQKSDVQTDVGTGFLKKADAPPVKP